MVMIKSRGYALASTFNHFPAAEQKRFETGPFDISSVLIVNNDCFFVFRFFDSVVMLFFQNVQVFRFE